MAGLSYFHPHPVDSRLRGNDGPGPPPFTSGLRIKPAMTGCREWMFVRIRIYRIMEDLQDWDDAVASFSPSPLIPLPSRERGFSRLFCLVVARPFTSGLRVKSAMTCDESRRIPHRHTGFKAVSTGQGDNKSKTIQKTFC